MAKTRIPAAYAMPEFRGFPSFSKSRQQAFQRFERTVSLEHGIPTRIEIGQRCSMPCIASHEVVERGREIIAMMEKPIDPNRGPGSIGLKKVSPNKHHQRNNTRPKLYS
jgi:hypothetical protein